MENEELSEWLAAISNQDLIGLWRDAQGQLMFDRRYKIASAMYRSIGPRTIDLNIIGPDSVPVPTEVERELW